jgi:hypothetical protein
MGRRVLGVSKMTTREVIQGELGWSKVRSRRIFLRLNFWYKIINMNQDRLIYKIYRARRKELIAGGYKDKKNWCYWTWKFLQNLHLEHLWKSEKLSSEKINFSNLVKKLIKIKEESEWRDQIEKKPKLRLYKKLKNKLVLEDYVFELDREERRHLTMLRGGTNKLRIETGRWKRESEHARVCNVCLCCEVEDERHFLLRCPRYVEERIKMFERIKNRDVELEYIENMDEDWQIQCLLGIGWRNNGKEIKKIVCNYIRRAHEIRNRYIK